MFTYSNSAGAQGSGGFIYEVDLTNRTSKANAIQVFNDSL